MEEDSSKTKGERLNVGEFYFIRPREWKIKEESDSVEINSGRVDVVSMGDNKIEVEIGDDDADIKDSEKVSLFYSGKLNNEWLVIPEVAILPYKMSSSFEEDIHDILVKRVKKDVFKKEDFERHILKEKINGIEKLKIKGWFRDDGRTMYSYSIFFIRRKSDIKITYVRGISLKSDEKLINEAVDVIEGSYNLSGSS